MTAAGDMTVAEVRDEIRTACALAMRAGLDDRNIQVWGTSWGVGVAVIWPKPDGHRGWLDPEVLAAHVTSRVPTSPRTDDLWLIPDLGPDHLPPVMLWWALIHGLSLLARYQPAEWRAALDLDRSEIADPLREVLDQAMEIVPELLFLAMDNH